MTKRYQNVLGVLAWIASRDGEASDEFHQSHNAALDRLARVVSAIHLTEFATVAGLIKAKAELVRACEDGRLVALGYTEDDGELRPVAETAWINVDLDEMEGWIGRGRPTWLGLVFKTSDVRALWPWLPTRVQTEPRRRTGPTPRLRAAIQNILHQHRLAEERALERGDTPPSPPTAAQIAAKLSNSLEKRVPERTVRHNIERIMSGNDSEPAGATN